MKMCVELRATPLVFEGVPLGSVVRESEILYDLMIVYQYDLLVGSVLVKIILLNGPVPTLV